MSKNSLLFKETVYGISMSSQFKKDLKKVIKQRKDLVKLQNVITFIALAKPLPKKYHNHQLTGNYAGCYECHIAPDWLLIYRIDNDILMLYLLRTGSHVELLEK